MSKPNNKTERTKYPQQNKWDFSGKKWLGVVLILFVTFLVFYPSVNYDFVNWDDNVNVTENPNIKNLNYESIKDIFTSSIIGGYNPLTTLSFAVEYHFFGLNPKPFHFFNLILHMLCVVLVFFVMKKMRMNFFITFSVALLFGIHPMRVESVAWISERKDVLYSFFYLLAVVSYIQFVFTKKLVYYILAITAFIFSLLSKIQAVSLPFTLLLIDYFFSRQFSFKQILNKIPFFMLSLVTGVVGIIFLEKHGSLETGTTLPFFQRIFIGTYSLCVYLIKSVIPYEMSAVYPNPSKLGLQYYISFPVIILIGYFVWKVKKYRMEILFGLLFFFFNIVFLLQVVGAGVGYIADRFTYIPYFGLFFIFAFLVNKGLGSKSKYIVITFISFYIVVLGIISYNRVKVWQDTETLFSDVISKYPEIPIAYFTRGTVYMNEKKYDRALKDYNKAIELKHDYVKAYFNRGFIFLDEKKYDLALEEMNKAIELDVDYTKAYYNRGIIFWKTKRHNDALIDFNKAIELLPDYIQAYNNRGNVLYDEKRYEEAILSFSKAIELNADNAVAYFNRGLSNYFLGNKDAACIDLKQADMLGLEQASDAIRQICGE